MIVEPAPERQVVLQIVAEPQEVERSLNQAYRKLSQQVNIPGFRRGKAPRPVLERFVGKEAMLDEAIESLGPQLYSQAIKEQNVEALGQGTIELKERAPVTFRATVPLKPVVELGDYKSIRLDPEPVIVTDDEVEQTVERLRALHALWEPQDRPVAVNDMVTLDLEGSVGEESVFKQTDLQYRVVAGASNPMAGFPEALVGMAKGETRSFTLSFPPDYADSRLAGQPCGWVAVAKEIKEERLPALNDELAQAVSDKYDSLAALREGLAAEIRARKDTVANSQHQQKAVEALVERAHLEYPPVMVEWEIDNILREHARRLAENRISVEEYLAQEKKTAAQLREELRPQATKTLRQSLVLGKVAEAEGLQVTEEEVQADIDTLVKALGEQGERVREALTQPQSRYSLELHLLSQKCLARLGELARGGPEGPAT